MARSESPSNRQSLNYHLQQEWRLVTAFLFVLTLLLSFYRSETGLRRLDNTFYDFTLTLTVPAPAPQDIVLIAIDDGSIAKLGYWPWRRTTHAELLHHLREARVVGMDMVFQEANPAYPDDDEILATAIATHGRVILPEVYHPSTGQLARPLAQLEQAAAQLGYINIYPDADGVVRKVKLWHPLPNADVLQHFSPAMLEVAADQDAVSTARTKLNTSARHIPFLGRPGHFNTLSYYSVLQGHYPPEFFKDKYVLIGAWSSGLGDTFSTPMSKAEQSTMSGMEILANIVVATQTDRWIDIPPDWVNALLSFVPVFILCLLFLRLSPRLAFVSLSFALLGIFMLNWVAMHWLGFWIPPTASLLVTLLAYPLWHWRSQEAALRQVSLDLEKLQLDYPEIKASLQGSSVERRARSLPQRLSLLHKSIDLLRQAQTKREETLRFISHDMRAPQNSLLALSALQKDPAHKLDSDALLEHVETYATQTLELVDNFMNLARAEAMDMALEPVNLADLLADSLDQCWALAQRKQVQLHYATTSEAWVLGNAPMLRRVLSNLIENAIKYGPAGNSVSANFIDQGELILLYLSDQGWGIAAEHLPSLFEPYHRAHSDQEHAPTGSGLGLAFVKTVIHRHGGDIQVQSVLGQGSTFIISLKAALAPQ